MRTSFAIRNQKQPATYLSIPVLFSFALIFINPAVGVGLLLFFSIFNIVTYLRYKTDLENYLLIISFQLRLLDASEKLLKLDIPELMEYKNRLADDLKALNGIRGAPQSLLQET